MINYTTILSYLGKTLYILLKVLFWIIVVVIGIIGFLFISGYLYSRLLEHDKQNSNKDIRK